MAEVEGRRPGGGERNKLTRKLWVHEFASEDENKLGPCEFVSVARNKLWLGKFVGFLDFAFIPFRVSRVLLASTLDKKTLCGRRGRLLQGLQENDAFCTSGPISCLKQCLQRCLLPRSALKSNLNQENIGNKLKLCQQQHSSAEAKLHHQAEGAVSSSGRRCRRGMA